jgi:UDP-N-acetylglucosamine--N-acetylmuramyl-(pentapeptide) pyrophosphoryl-undecaprenol N-acetylglucosamine transferase
LPSAPGDHQRANAAALAGPGGAVVIDDAACTTEELADVLGVLVDDADGRAAMRTALAAVARPDAAERVAALLEEHARVA